ncbi:hypothetical protein CC1G_10105 [Coprinopsis cinerea okayama7|uniref:Uncharacterized protein n=1 Tax=Coprinopsis cinerea (strain Okayama-7 / 130 / ATCC MYA-4618 / FGSC 9003) TaxID=240176 RepID=A8N402_COPC7|nr:hypothetical protein CC1G_10105 [Coprinopsis cinerea okayama7\|eukprot:XP_001829575.1 hypothetical protein CC1G_10105 [Coprinopsis cinerea okayama7\
MSDAAPPAAPPVENPLYVFEHSLYVGNYMSGILYGISLMMYIATMQGLLQKSVTRTSAKARRFFAIYSTILFLLLTIDIAVNAIWSQLCWIDGRNHPGGVLGYIGENMAVWYQTMGSTTVVAMIFMGDALLLYRMYVIWGQNIYVLILPCLAYLCAFALAIIQLVTAAMPGASLFNGKSINFGVPYYTITISLNVVITSLICYRLRRLSKTVSQALGRDNARMYTSVAAMLVESAAPYSLVGIMFLIPYALESQTALSFGQVWAKLTCICPQMIVFRVISGKGWTKETVTQAESTVVFSGNRPGAMASGIELRSQHYSTHNTTLGGTVNEKWDGERSTKSLNTTV